MNKMYTKIIAPEIQGGQTHTVEIVIFVLIAVVLGLFVYTVGVPAIEDFWKSIIAQIGTIK
ncbi:MAG: hypothetical protein RR997_00055 [Raoultibacter sp.]